MHLFSNPLVWLRRVRKRCGYGVHSPFAFHFITDVIYEKSRYYAYSSLDACLPFRYRFRVRKCLRLLFRIANSVQPHTVYIQGSMPFVRQYVEAGCHKAVVTDKVGDADIDMCVLSSPCDVVVPHIRHSGVLVLGNLRKHRRWFLSLPSVVSFDLWDIGIAFFDPHYNKQHYIVNF